MKTADTTFLIDLMEGIESAKKFAKENKQIMTTQLNMYEVIRGFFSRQNPSSALSRAFDTFDAVKVLPLNDNGIVRSAEISSLLKKKGLIISDVDCLTAGISLSMGVTTIVTRNLKHFNRIPGIRVETY